MAEWGSILKMVALLSLLYVALFCTACMRSGQTVRWVDSDSLSSKGQSLRGLSSKSIIERRGSGESQLAAQLENGELLQGVWIGCQNLQEEDVVIAVGGSKDNLHCQIAN